jgi:hypothetical protein
VVYGFSVTRLGVQEAKLLIGMLRRASRRGQTAGDA